MDDSKPLATLNMLCSAFDRKFVCEMLSISEQYLSDILKGRRPISDVIGKKLGFEKVWKETK